MKTSHIVIICVTVFLLVALWLSYKAMVLTAEKDEREADKQRAMGVAYDTQEPSFLKSFFKQPND